VGGGDVATGHPLELAQFLELTRRDEVVAFLTGKELENALSMRVQIQLVVVAILRGEYQL